LGERQTFEEFATVDLSGCDFEGNDMALEINKLAMYLRQTNSLRIEGMGNGGVEGMEICTHLRLVQELDWYSDSARHGVLDLSSWREVYLNIGMARKRCRWR